MSGTSGPTLRCRLRCPEESSAQNLLIAARQLRSGSRICLCPNTGDNADTRPGRCRLVSSPALPQASHPKRAALGPGRLCAGQVGPRPFLPPVLVPRFVDLSLWKTLEPVSKAAGLVLSHPTSDVPTSSARHFPSLLPPPGDLRSS